MENNCLCEDDRNENQRDDSVNKGMADIGLAGNDCGVAVCGNDDEKYGVTPSEGGKRIARIISMVLNPLLMPLYFIVLLLYGGTMLLFLPVQTKIFFIFTVLLNTLIVPLLFIGFLKSTGQIKSFKLIDEKDRILPLIVTAFCYAVCAYIIKDMLMAFVVKRVLMAGAACILFATAVTYYWKISLHMVALGGGLAILIIITVSKLGFLQPWIIALIAGSGLVASARLYLGCHTPMQIVVGFLTGFTIAFMVMLF